jgi:hypothetical protein
MTRLLKNRINSKIPQIQYTPKKEVFQGLIIISCAVDVLRNGKEKPGEAKFHPRGKFRRKGLFKVAKVL